MTSPHYNNNKSYLGSQCCFAGTTIKNSSNTIKATYDNTIIKNNIQKAQLLDKHYTNEVIMIQDEINKLIVFEGLQYFRGIFCEDEAFNVEIFNLRLNRHILLIENLLCNLEYAINRFNLLYNKCKPCSANNNNCSYAENFSMSASLGTIINNTFAYDLAIKAFLNNYYNISNKIYYIIQNNIERSELNIKSYAAQDDTCYAEAKRFFEGYADTTVKLGMDSCTSTGLVIPTIIMNLKSASAFSDTTAASSCAYNNNTPVPDINDINNYSNSINNDNNNKNNNINNNNNNKVNMIRSGYSGAFSTIFGTTQTQTQTQTQGQTQTQTQTQQHQYLLQNKSYAAQQINKIVNRQNLLNNQKQHRHNNTLLFNYLKRMSIYNIRTNGLLIYNYHILKYNFNKNYSLLFHPYLLKASSKATQTHYACFFEGYADTTIAIPRNNNNNINNNNNNNKSYLGLPPIKGTGWINLASNEIHNFLKAFFKSINSLISKPTFVITPDKITISLFYYLSIPSPKVFNLYNSKLLMNATATRTQYLLIKKNINNNNKKSYAKTINFGAQPFDPETSNIEKSRALKILIRKQYKKKNKLNLFNNYNLTKLYPLRFKKICDYFSLFFNKPVEFELIRLHHYYNDAHILVTLLALIVRRKKIRKAITNLYSLNAVENLKDPNLFSGNRAGGTTATLSSEINSYSLEPQYNIPAFLSGLNIKIAGRLMRESIIPRRTTKIFEKGASATGKVNFLEVAKLTKKNRKGAFTITVLSGQNFF
jgi:Mitochondrial ribosomal protein (VAR1)